MHKETTEQLVEQARTPHGDRSLTKKSLDIASLYDLKEGCA
ncbi:hypothetical protein AB6E53_01900 [Vibrio breoganii]